MKKLLWPILMLVSLIISVIINFNKTSFSSFIINSLIFTLIIFIALVLIIKIVKSIKEKNIKKVILLLFLLIILLFIYGIGNFIFTSLVSPTETPAHFRTNILTGKCDFGGWSPNAVSDPWYYSPGCESDE